MLQFLFTFARSYIVISAIWPDTRKKQVDADRKHNELLDAIARIERQGAVSVPPPPLPTYGSAERARVLALGRIRDGAERHPLLDTPWWALPIAEAVRISIA